MYCAPPNLKTWLRAWSAAALGAVKGVRSNEKFENHCSMVSSSAL